MIHLYLLNSAPLCFCLYFFADQLRVHVLVFRTKDFSFLSSLFKCVHLPRDLFGDLDSLCPPWQAGVPSSAVPFAASDSDEIVIGPWLLSWAGAFEWCIVLWTSGLDWCSQWVLSIGALKWYPGLSIGRPTPFLTCQLVYCCCFYWTCC